MQVGAETIRPRLPEIEEAVGQLPRLQAAQTQAGDVRLGQERGGQLLQVGGEAAGQVPPVGAQMDAGEHGFLVACVGQPLHFGHNFAQSAAAAFPPQGGDNAESAFVVAAVLHLYKSPGAAEAVRSVFGGGKRRAVGLDAGHIFGIVQLRAPRLQQGVEQLLLPVVGHQRHAGQAGRVLRLQGGVAAGDSDTGLRVGAVKLAHGSPAAADGLGRHRAGVEDDHLRALRRGRDLMAGGGQAPGQCVVFAVVQAAAQLVEVDAHCL